MKEGVLLSVLLETFSFGTRVTALLEELIVFNVIRNRSENRRGRMKIGKICVFSARHNWVGRIGDEWESGPSESRPDPLATKAKESVTGVHDPLPSGRDRREASFRASNSGRSPATRRQFLLSRS